MLPSLTPDQGFLLMFVLATLLHYTEEEGSHFALLYLLAGLGMADFAYGLVAAIWVGILVLLPRFTHRFS